MLVGVFGWVVLGMIAGFIASKVVVPRGDDPKMGICLAAIAAVVALVVWHGWRWKAAS